MAYNMGGPLSQDEDRQRMLAASRNKIAKSQASATPLAPQQPVQPAQPGRQSSPMGQAALSSLLGPLGGMLGGLFNEGGKVQQKKKTWWDYIWGSKTGKPGSLASQINWGGAQRKNMGGPISAYPNPHGYNEGGAVAETPIKKVMDEQKLEQQAMAFELEQKRKQEAHDQTMRIKETQAKQAAAMKKASATTSKQPTKPSGPLASNK